jgi:hypothetical protein
MIKQTWNIGTDERTRILQLHENATKKLYLLSEQNPVQGPSPNVVIDQDENYMYFLSQPNFSVTADYVDWKKDYFVYASDGEKSYQTTITSKDEKGRPTNVEVLKDKILPDIRKNEFVFDMVKLPKKEGNYNYTYGNEITKSAFLYQAQEASGLKMNVRYFAVTWYNGKPITVAISAEGGLYGKENRIDYDDLELYSETPFNPYTDVFVSRKLGAFSLIMPTLFSSYPVGIGRTQPETPGETPGKKPTPPPPPVPLGDKFMDNVSMPTADAILKDPKFIEFKKFVDGNDMSKFVFDIQSSASKCSAGFKESNKANGKWSEDKATYPDVTVDSQADKNDLGNLNLTKARAQNLKNFLVANVPKLKDAKFRVIAQGSKGKCGTEEENREFRRVDLTVTAL